jgi:hypothetical protein
MRYIMKYSITDINICVEEKKALVPSLHPKEELLPK